ncbi:MAG: PEGA domain-containing protein [Bdellovibrio sp.]
MVCRRFIVFLSSLILSQGEALAIDRPLWISNPPKSDGIYVYVVGVGEAEKLTAAKAGAEKDAKLQIIDIAVGALSTISQKIVNDSMVSILEESMAVDTDFIQIRGLETESMFDEVSSKQTIRVFILKRISRADLKELRNRYQRDPSVSVRQAEVSIKTEPAKAKVFIGGKYQGVTPLVLNLAEGTYEISVEKNEYKSVDKKIMVDPQNPANLYFALEAEVGYFRMKQVLPVDARIQIDGKDYGVSVGDQMQLSVGHHEIVVSSPGYEQYSETFEIFPDKILNVEVQLKFIYTKIWTEEVRQIMALVDAKKYQDAIDYGIKEAASGNDFTLGNYYIGYSYFKLQNYDDAVKWLKLAAPLKRRYSQILYFQCYSLNKMNYQQSALKVCKEALKYFPDDGEINFLIGTIYEDLARDVFVLNYYKFAYQAFKIASKEKSKWKLQMLRYCAKEEVKQMKGCSE